jgi:hypothetical protein
LSTISYINCITLSNRTLTLTGTTAEDKALQWLVVEDTLSLTPNSEPNKTRLRQRFALLTFGFQASSYGNYVFQNARWNLASESESECDWWNDAYMGFQCENGQVTNIATDCAVIAGTLPPDLSWLTAMKHVSLFSSDIVGTLPTHLGWWTNLETFEISGGQYLQGSIPSSIGAWTSIIKVLLSQNMLTGTIPASIGAWTALTSLLIDDNKLTGTIPASIGA